MPRRKHKSGFQKFVDFNLAPFRPPVDYFLSHPGVVKDIGGTMAGVGEVMSVVGVATGQPELVAAGVGVREAGQSIETVGKVAEKAKQTHDKIKEVYNKPTIQGTVDLGKQIYSLGQEIKAFDNQFIQKENENLTALSNVVDSQRAIINQEAENELEIITKEHETIDTAINVINELSDRLAEASNSPKSADQFIAESKRMGKDQFLEFLTRNENSFMALPQEVRYNVFRSAGF